MALSFHIFNTIWTPSLQRRFQFGPADYGQFFSFIGVAFAVSQGFVAARLIRWFGTRFPRRGRVALLGACCVTLGVGRWLALVTNRLWCVYAVFSCVITALGVMNTILTADTSKIAAPAEIGGFLGLLEAVESGAGMVGPLLGGLLGKLGGGTPTLPLFTVVTLYGLLFVLVVLRYDTYVAPDRLDTNEKERVQIVANRGSNTVGAYTDKESKKLI